MLMLISPAKTLDFEPIALEDFSQPRFLTQSKALVRGLKKLKSEDIKQLMGVSDNIATLNVARFKQFKPPFTLENAKQAVLAFKGDVYLGLQANEFNTDELSFAQNHLRILSGLYGLLKPLDLMQPYRLEMGTSLENKKGKNLYQFWGDSITKLINKDLKEQGDDIVLNLASQEYFKAVNKKKLKGKLYNINFKENRNGIYKVISFSAKKARGQMSRYIIKNGLSTIEEVKTFDEDNYFFNPDLSDEFNLMFTR